MARMTERIMNHTDIINRDKSCTTRLAVSRAAKPPATWKRFTTTRRLLCCALPALILAVPAVAVAELPAMLLNIVYVALGLGLVIFFHELGHFAVAKWCDVLVERFSIGFGPILWSRKYGETEYALSAVPFGGYVKMLGQDDMDPSQLTSEEIAQDPRSYSAKPVWQRMAIISAGVTMNILTAILFFAAAFGLGVVTPQPMVGGVIAGSPAWSAGLRTGDTITEINGDAVDGFGDIIRGVALSSGAVSLKGTHPDDRPFTLAVTPDKSGTRRELGFWFAYAPEVARLAKGQDPILPGSAASRAKPPLQAGDRIVAIADEPIETYGELLDGFARRRAESVTLTLERPKGEKRDGLTETVRSVVGPMPMRGMGLRVQFGKIAAVVAGSPANRAGIQPGDTITHVDGQDVGGQLDPLRLPYLFGDRAGRPVEVTLQRDVRGGAPETVQVVVTPDDRPGWTEQPQRAGEPLAIPAIGIAFHLVPRVLNVIAGSPAAQQDIKQGDLIEKISLTLPVDAPPEPNGADAKPIVIAMDGKGPGDIPQQNYAFAFAQIQKYPAREVVLTVSHDGKSRAVTLPAWTDPAEPWFFPSRGFVLAPLEGELKAKSFGGAVAMGAGHTRSSVVELYLTLRNLLTGDLSPKELHGPMSIARIAYEVADQGFSQLLMFLGFLSVNLAVLNFLPIPVLDGGHMVFLLWEAVTRRKPSERVVAVATVMGFAFIILLMLSVTYLDLFIHKTLGGG